MALALLAVGCHSPTASAGCPVGYDLVDEGQPAFRACERNIFQNGRVVGVDVVPLNQPARDYMEARQ